jgi:hypothetical protein
MPPPPTTARAGGARAHTHTRTVLAPAPRRGRAYSLLCACSQLMGIACLKGARAAWACRETRRGEKFLLARRGGWSNDQREGASRLLAFWMESL